MAYTNEAALREMEVISENDSHVVLTNFQASEHVPSENGAVVDTQKVSNGDVTANGHSPMKKGKGGSTFAELKISSSVSSWHVIGQPCLVSETSLQPCSIQLQQYY